MIERGHGGDRDAQYIQGVREGFLKKELFISVSKGAYEFSQEKEGKRKTTAGGISSINKDKGKECHNVCMELQIVQYCCKLKFRDGNG